MSAGPVRRELGPPTRTRGTQFFPNLRPNDELSADRVAVTDRVNKDQSIVSGQYGSLLERAKDSYL
jgi:hypothetical protein